MPRAGRADDAAPAAASYSERAAHAAAARARARAASARRAGAERASIARLDELSDDVLVDRLLCRDLSVASAVSLGSTSHRFRTLLPESILSAWRQSVRHLVRCLRALCVQTRTSVSTLLKGLTVLDVRSRLTADGYRALILLCSYSAIGDRIDRLNLSHNMEVLGAREGGFVTFPSAVVDAFSDGRLEMLTLHAQLLGSAPEAPVAVGGHGLMEGLRELNMNNNRVGDATAKALAGWIEFGGLPLIERLDLGCNDIGDDGVLALSSAIARRCGLSRCDASCFCENCLLSSSLSLPFTTESATPSARVSLSRHRCEHLLLCNNLIADRGMGALAQTLACGALSRLLNLQLSSNHIGDVGILAFVHAMSTVPCPPSMLQVGIAAMV